MSQTSQYSKTRIAVTVAFIINGSVLGSFYARIADIKSQLQITNSALGFALLCIAVGVLIGLGLSLLQLKFQWIHLDESAYLIDVLPIQIQPLQVIGVIVGTAIICYVSFLLPTIWIKKISPAKAIRFD